MNIYELLNDEKFKLISDDDKSFILAFDNAMNGFGYDFGGRLYGNATRDELAYSKTGLKSKKFIARVYVRKDNGEVSLRLYCTDINKHRAHIESAPPYIKDAFTFEWGDCQNCMPTCKSMKNYTIDDQQYNKCCHNIAQFANPTVDRLPDYMALLSAFYPAKKAKAAK